MKESPKGPAKLRPETNRIYTGDAIDLMRGWPDAIVQTCVTSPPYYKLRDYGVEGQIGLEPTIEEFVETMVTVFAEVRRLLRDDGILWLNLGDTYYGSWGGQGEWRESSTNNRRVARHKISNHPKVPRRIQATSGLKPKDLIGIPWRVALAQQQDGWYLRRDIIWSKPNPMPESTTDRPTTAHEYIFMLTKSERYYYDAEAVKEKAEWGECGRISAARGAFDGKTEEMAGTGRNAFRAIRPFRNKRSVWTVPVLPFNDAHFATFPPDLIGPCILAATSEQGACIRCGAPRRRILDRKPAGDWNPRDGATGDDRVNRTSAGLSGSRFAKEYEPPRTKGWEASCRCKAKAGQGVVLDPFMGAGTTALVAATLNRAYIGCELNPKSVEIAERRIAGETAQGKMF